MRVRRQSITWSLTLPDFQPELRLSQIDANRRSSSFVGRAAMLRSALNLRFHGFHVFTIDESRTRRFATAFLGNTRETIA